jgi:DNA-binding HxlR family transcriptional regulator
MSQSIVLELLNELGGVASLKEIRALAKKKYPDTTLHSYISDRLRKLEKWGTVKRKIENSKIVWIVNQDEL